MLGSRDGEQLVCFSTSSMEKREFNRYTRLARSRMDGKRDFSRQLQVMIMRSL